MSQPIVYHLSHIDLDGYACQYLTTRCFEHISCYNANYGPEVTAKLEQIVKRIEADKAQDDTQTRLILVTDLNLTTKEGNWLEKEAMRIGAKIQLLDHHGTGANAAERFAWYRLDTSKSATLITYEWLRKHYGFDPQGEYEPIVRAVNAIDIWLSDDEAFEYGKVMLGMISGAREINRTLFPEEDRAFKLAMIDAAKARINEHEAPIVLDDALHQIKKSFFKRDKNDTKDNLVADYVAALLTKDKERLLITYKGYKGLLGYNVGSSSVIGNAVLRANPDIDFYMDVNQRGNISLRSNDKVDVSKIAEEIGNGGGHPNAAGGKIENFKDAFVYEEFRDYIQEYLNQKAQTSSNGES